MLKSIIMRNVATYDNIGVTFDNLNKVNLIYGPNGTGKTTISNFLKYYSKNRIAGEVIPPQFSGCQVQWGRDISPEILVYNRAFKKENIGNTTIPGVFVMGKSAVDNSKRIQEIQDELRTIRTEVEDLTTSQQQVKESYLFGGSIFQALLADIDSRISEEANSLYAKSMDGLKRDHNKRIDKILEVLHRIGSVTVLSEADIRKTIGIVNTKDVDPLSTINLPSLASLRSIEQENIWNKVIIGSGDVDFAGFINSLGISDWVRQGIGKIDNTDGVCPFCQQHTISSELIEKFNNYFNDDYKNEVKKIERFTEVYKSDANILVEFLTNLLNNAKYTEYIDADKLKGIISGLKKHHKLNLASMAKKTTSPSDKIDLEDGVMLYDELEDFIAKVNISVSERNSLIAHKNKLKGKLPEQVWDFLVNKYKSGIELYYQQRIAAMASEKAIMQKQDKLHLEETSFNKEISELRAQSSDSIAVVERINQILERLQFNSFRLRSYDQSSYQIVRQTGEIASNTLSEGEETLISFLYYIHLLDGSTNANTPNRNIIAVIDDPISSLDNSILSFVAREIKNLMFRCGDINENIKQVIVLTHNIHFHKSLSLSPVAFDKDRKKKTFFIIAKDFCTHKTVLNSCSQENNVESEYNSLWSLMKSAYEKINSSNGGENKEYKYTIQNTMRRIYETFFSNTCGLSNFDIATMFKNAGKDQEADCFRNLIEWLNEGSHSADMNDFKDVPSDAVIQMYMKIFEETFRITGNFGQYQRLMKI